MIARLTVFAIAAALAASAQTPPPRQAPDPQKLETQVEANPEDLNARSLLLHAYLRSAGAKPDEIRPLRRRHILWLVEHHPEAPVLGETAGVIEASADPQGYADAQAAWRKHFAGGKAAPIVVAHAIHFFETSDPAYARKLAADGLE